MRNIHKGNRFVYSALVVSLVVLMACLQSGCSKQYLLADEEGRPFGSPQQQYKVLSFFLDGVPNPDDIQESPTIDKAGLKKALAQQSTRVTEHGPFAAKQCVGCHERGTNKLLLPIQELCLRCHVVAQGKKWVHGPVASGGCRVCHNPHSSPYPFLLESASTDFCFHCHAKSDIYKNEVHKDVVRCTDCHDAHASDNRMLLK